MLLQASALHQQLSSGCRARDSRRAMVRNGVAFASAGANVRVGCFCLSDFDLLLKAHCWLSLVDSE
ncbi:hypothetical protein RCH17_003460 [Arthrobacter sp. MP_M7]|nr:hypothetical protein [Arthrobacter sp. MP_M4]MEC5204630.1 hypothetical protein [Arthrobacter sp. MP_M7]